MDFGFSQVEVIYIYGECKKRLKEQEIAKSAGVSGGPGEKKTLRSIIQKMERCCPAVRLSSICLIEDIILLGHFLSPLRHRYNSWP